MLAAAIVTVLLDGAIEPSFAQATIVAGRVVAPLAPIVVRLAARAAYEPGRRRISLERSGRRIAVPVAFVADGTPYVAIASLVRELGGDARFDVRTKTLALAFAHDGEVATPVPFDPRAPQVSPSPVFTPEPPRPTPRVVETGVPVPRRTAIPVTGPSRSAR